MSGAARRAACTSPNRVAVCTEERTQAEGIRVREISCHAQGPPPRPPQQVSHAFSVAGASPQMPGSRLIDQQSQDRADQPRTPTRLTSTPTRSRRHSTGRRHRGTALREARPREPRHPPVRPVHDGITHCRGHDVAPPWLRSLSANSPPTQRWPPTPSTANSPTPGLDGRPTTGRIIPAPSPSTPFALHSRGGNQSSVGGICTSGDLCRRYCSWASL